MHMNGKDGERAADLCHANISGSIREGKRGKGGESDRGSAKHTYARALFSISNLNAGRETGMGPINRGGVCTDQRQQKSRVNTCDEKDKDLMQVLRER